MRKIKRIMGILLSWMLLIGTFQLLPIEIDGSETVSAAALSGDNSLSSLSISPGTLSPAFQYNVVNYTASVGADVSSIEVNAKLSNETAKIESVSGNTDLQAGENLISIVVKAQNGTPATYKIVVTKEAGAENETQQPEDGAQQPEDGGQQPEDGGQQPENGGENTGGITIDGHPFDLSPTISADLVPQDFTKTTVTCMGKQVEGLTFDKSELTLVYLTTPSTDVKNTLAVYDEAGGFYPFRKVQYGETNYLIVLNPPAESGLSQEYTQTSQTVGEFQNVPAFVAGAAPSAAETPESDGEEGSGKTEFSLVYGVSSHGNKGWYQYDAVETTFQRFVPVAAESEQPSPVEQPEDETSEPGAEMQSLQKAYTDMETQYNAQKDLYRKTTAVMSFVIAVLLVIMVNLLLRGRKNEEDEWEEEDYEELSEKVREQVKSARRSRRDDGQIPDLKGGQSELWEDKSVPKSILRQQTKTIPQVGKVLPDEMELPSKAKGKKAPESQKGKMAEPRREKIPKTGKIPEPVAEKQWNIEAEKQPMPNQVPKVTPSNDFDDFEVIDLEDL